MNLPLSQLSAVVTTTEKLEYPKSNVAVYLSVPLYLPDNPNPLTKLKRHGKVNEMDIILHVCLYR